MNKIKKIHIYLDGPSEKEIKIYKSNLVKGFTYNPSLMSKLKVKDYLKACKKFSKRVSPKPISLEVFADDPSGMIKQADTISKIRTKWLAEYESEPSVRQLSKETGVSQQTISYCLKVTTIQTNSIDDSPELYRSTDFEEKEYPIINAIERIHNRLGLSDEPSLFALYATLEDKEPLPEPILELFKERS